MKPEPLFHIARDEGQVAGPYDVVQMASLLRRKIISGETMTCLDDTDDWKPFSWQPQFSVAREMPADAVSARILDLDDAAAAAKSGPIPLPSREALLKIASLLAVSFLAGVLTFLVAWHETTLGYGLLFLGGCAGLLAQCMIMVRLLDEDAMTLFIVFFLPGGDIYYFLSNIWEYFTWFCVKYVGLAILAGAAAGMAMHSAH